MSDLKTRALALCEHGKTIVAKACPGPWRTKKDEEGDSIVTTKAMRRTNKGRTWPAGQYLEITVDRGSAKPRGTAHYIVRSRELVIELCEKVVPDLLVRLSVVEAERDALLREKQWYRALEDIRVDMNSMEPNAARRMAFAKLRKMAAYGETLREQRISRGASLASCAAVLGCSEAEVEAVESGRAPPFEESVTKALCSYFKYPPDGLLFNLKTANEVIRG